MPDTAAVPARRGHRNRFTAALLAFAAGGLGLHRAYLGSAFWWAYPVWLTIGMMVFGWLGTKSTTWILVLALLPVWVGFAECMGFAVMADHDWDSRWNATAGQKSRNGWNCILLAIACLLLGTSLCVTVIAISAQFYYEAAAEQANPS